jgi:HEAT repeat protein
LEVLNILGLTGSEKALPALIRLIRERETSLPVLQKAFWAIGETGSVSVVVTLLPFLKDPQSKIVAWAAGALGQIGDKSAAMGLFLALKHDDTEVKHMAVWALEKLSGKRLGTEATRWETWVREQTPRR